jgi:lipid II:glycine glycyltransferase (peptidoglycan interpeptide bridge formation enzyme)
MAAMLKALQADGARFVDMWGVVEPDDEEADPSWKGFSDFKRTFGGTRAIRAVARIPLCRGYGPRSRTYIGCQR